MSDELEIAWKNNRILETARQEEMKTRDVAEAALANPTTILELCGLLEKAEEALEFGSDLYDDSKNQRDLTMALYEWVNTARPALAAIKQWKEQT